MKKRGDVVRAITQQLEINGLMTLADLVVATGLEKNSLWAVLRRMSAPTIKPAMPKRVYIAEWVYDQEGQKRYPRPLYGLGSGPDAKRPVADRRANKQRYVQRKRTRMATNSVFNLAGVIKRGTFEIRL